MAASWSCVLMLLAIGCLLQVYGQDVHENKTPTGRHKGPKHCVGPIDRKRVHQAVEACHYMLEKNHPEMSDVECFIKCALLELKLTDERGMPDKAALSHFMQNGSKEYKWIAYTKHVLGNCFGKPVREIDPTNPQCSGYARFVVCLLSNKVVDCPKQYLE